MDLSYSQIRNMTCPIRHYFTLIKNNKDLSILPIIIGNIVHKIYSQALLNKNFNFYNDKFVKNELHKIGQHALYDKVCNILKNHIHKNAIQKFPCNVKIEKQYTVSTVNLPHIDQIVNIYNKPDITYLHKGIATVCEIKTGAYNQYDPLQLLYYAWGMSIHTNAEYFITKVFHTADNNINVIYTMDKEELQKCMDRYFESSKKAYVHLGITSIIEVSSIIPTLIANNSHKLTELFNIIHPEQCASCNSFIVCPAYQQEIIKIFKQRMQNIPISDMMMQCEIPHL